jgi:hypothetical protein
MIKNVILFLILSFALILQACSAERIHSVIQEDQKQKCTAPNSQYDECIKRANESYEEYSSKQKEVIKNKTER